MTVMEAIEARRSVRSYSSRPVTQQELEAVLEAGVWPPRPATGRPGTSPPCGTPPCGRG